MTRGDAFRIAGFTLWFWSHDHRPPHFHVKRAGEWEIRVFIETTTSRELAFSTVFEKRPGPSRATRRTLAALVVEHGEALLLEWEDKVQP